MPNRDGTGPRGQGRGTGRGRGNCGRNVHIEKNENVVYGKCDGTGKGFGRKHRHQ